MALGRHAEGRHRGSFDELGGAGRRGSDAAQPGSASHSAGGFAYVRWGKGRCSAAHVTDPGQIFWAQHSVRSECKVPRFRGPIEPMRQIPPLAARGVCGSTRPASRGWQAATTTLASSPPGAAAGAGARAGGVAVRVGRQRARKQRRRWKAGGPQDGPCARAGEASSEGPWPNRMDEQARAGSRRAKFTPPRLMRRTGTTWSPSEASVLRKPQ